MKVQLMHVSEQGTHRLLRAALERVMMFTERYESDADTEILYAELAAAYFQTQPTTMLWVGLNDDEQIVAHLFATIDNYYGGRFVTIHQLLKDSGEEITEEQRAEMFGALKEWGRGHGCTDIRVYAINDAVAGVFEEGYGFTRTERVMLKTPIEERKEN